MISFLCKTDKMPEVIISGKVSVEAPNKHFRRKPSEYILYFINKGNMQIMEDGIIYALSKGDVIILDPARTHEGVLTYSDVEYYYVHFTTDDITETDADEKYIDEQLIRNRIDSGIKEQLILPKYIKISEFYHENILSLFNRLLSVYDHKQIYYKTQSNCCLMELLINISKNMINIPISRHDVVNDVVIQIIDYIHEHCHNRLTSKDIEAFFHMNFDYLNRQFRVRTGTTIINYANRYRIEESKKLLQSGLYNIRQTAEIMGFANEFYFSRVYKKFQGVSPAGYYGHK